MVNVKKVVTLLLLMVLIFTMSTSVSFASGSSGSIDSVLMLTEDGTIVSISIDDYVNMFLFEEGALYNFLTRGSGELEIYGIVSGDKYITIDSYVDAYISDSDTALEDADAISASEVAEFKEVANVDEETGEVELIPISGETPVVDKSDLKVAIADAKDLVEEEYTPETWAILEEALAAAELVLEDPNATQEQIDEALLELNEAMASLVKETPIEVDPVELEAAIEDAKALVETDYTPATWAILEEALAAAELVLEDPNATQEQIDEALLELNEAMASLVKETPTEATVTAVYEASIVPFMGYVKATAYNIPEAAKYTVTYKLSDGRPETSPFMLFGQTEGLPLVFQNETVTINVYDANSNLIDVFQNVPLVK